MSKHILSPSDGGDDHRTAVLSKSPAAAIAIDPQTPSRAKAVLAIDDRSPWAISLLNDGLFSVEQTVCIDGKTFLVGPVFKNDRLYVIALVDSGDGRFIPRLFYKSLSQGSWRCSPHIETEIKKGGKTHDLLSKGYEARNFSYTQTTRVTRQLALALDTQEQKGNHRKIGTDDIKKYFHEDNLDNLFNDPDFQYNMVLTFAEETDAFDFQEHGFDADPFEYCRKINGLVRKKRKKGQKEDGYMVLNEYAALRNDAIQDPEKVIRNFYQYKDKPYADKILKRALNVAIEKDPELIFRHYESYREKLYAGEIIEKALRKTARKEPEIFLKYCHLCEEMPCKDTLIEQALRLLFAKSSRAWDYFQHYVDQPYAYELLKAEIERNSFQVIQHFPVYEGQPYADEILQEALERNQEAAVCFFEKYQDRPYARKVFRKASRKHPEVLLDDLYNRHYRPKSSSEKKKLEKLVCATLEVKPGRILWLYPIFLDESDCLDPSRLAELNLLEKAARGAAEQDPANFFERFEDCIIDKPYADELLEKALRTAAEMCPEIAVENSCLYKDKSYYGEVFLASAMKLAESDPRKMFQCFNTHPSFNDNPYKKQVLEKTVMTAVEKDPQAAVIYFECYKNQPYADETFEKAMADSADVEKSVPGLVPEFMQENIIAVYSGMHHIAGAYTIEIYEVECRGQKFEWEMAYDKKGRVWIEGINVADCPVNTFGIRSQFINSGILTKKPFDYHHNNYGLKRGKGKRYYNKSYDDVTPFLDLLPPIQKFRQQRGIFRKKSIQRRSEKN